MRFLSDRWEELLQEMPELKRATFEDLGQEVLDQVRECIGGTGKVQDWQYFYVGSRWGYVAVRPKRKMTYYTPSKRWWTGKHKYTVGHITNAINSGHSVWNGAIPFRDRKGRRRWQVVKHGLVQGKHFYEDAAARSDELIDMAAKRLEARMKELVEQ